jgi:hypothetical protein
VGASTAEDLSVSDLRDAGYRVVFAQLDDAYYVTGDGIVVVSTTRPGALGRAASGILRPRAKSLPLA